MSDNHFSNHTVSLSELPQSQPVDIKSLSGMYYRANLIIRSAVTLLLLTALLVVKYQVLFDLATHLQQSVAWAFGAVLVIGLYWMVFGYLSDRAKAYQIRELDITCYSGVIFKKVVTQPFLRLQHIELKRGPVERKVGLATIQVFSAGGVQHTFTLPGLSVETANSLRQYILDHKDVTAHA